MDVDPELAVTLTNGRRVLAFQIAATAAGAWRVQAPGLASVVPDAATALMIRERFDRQIARQLAAGWRPADPVPVMSVPLPPDLVLQITTLVEALARSRRALTAADPTGGLIRASDALRLEARRLGLADPNGWIGRARTYRRLGELAEARGDLAAARFYYHAALRSHRRVGVAQRLARLERADAGSPNNRPIEVSVQKGLDTGAASSERCVHADRRRESRDRPSRACVASRCTAGRADQDRSRRTAPGDHARGAEPRPLQTTGATMTSKRIQIVGRIPAALKRRVRAAAARRKLSLTALLIEALSHAVTPKQSTT